MCANNCSPTRIKPLSPDSQFEKLSYLMIETNSACNLACPSCNREHLIKLGYRKPEVISAERFQEMLNVFAPCSIDTIKVEGLSEPMLHPQFDRLLAQVRNSFPRAFIIIATNLQYELKRVPFVDSLPFVDMVYLSIDGVGETYERLRLGASYSRLLRTLQDIQELVPAETRKDRLFINATISEENYKELPAIYEMRDRYGLAGVRINLAQHWTENELNPNHFSSELLEDLKTYRDDVKGVGSWQYQDCFWPWNGVIVDVFGNIRQCVINTSQKALTNVLDPNFPAFFNENKYYRDVREALSANLPPPSCRTCDYHHLAPYLEQILGTKSPSIRPRAIDKA